MKKMGPPLVSALLAFAGFLAASCLDEDPLAPLCDASRKSCSCQYASECFGEASHGLGWMCEDGRCVALECECSIERCVYPSECPDAQTYVCKGGRCVYEPD